MSTKDHGLGPQCWLPAQVCGGGGPFPRSRSPKRQRERQ